MRAVADAGADAIEIGIPFSDPVMDGPAIQQASRAGAGARAPRRQSILDELAGVDARRPARGDDLLQHRLPAGPRALRRRRCAGPACAAAILPDLPLEESGPWCAAADARRRRDRAARRADHARRAAAPRLRAASRGFVYAVGLLGVTGERAELAATATVIAGRLKAVTDLPVLVGVGVSTPEQAVEACRVADGVVVGTTVVRAMMSGGGPAAVGDAVAAFRSALDRG